MAQVRIGFEDLTKSSERIAVALERIADTLDYFKHQQEKVVSMQAEMMSKMNLGGDFGDMFKDLFGEMKK